MGNTLRWTVFMGGTFAHCSASGHHLQMGESPRRTDLVETSTVMSSRVDRPRIVDARFGNESQLQYLQSQRVDTGEQAMEGRLVWFFAADDPRSAPRRDDAVLECTCQRVARRSFERKLVHQLSHEVPICSGENA